MKTCVTCHQLKPLEAFNVRRAARDGLQSRCRDCSRAWYQANRQRHIVAAGVRSRRVRAQYQERLHAFLADHPCIDCGESDIRTLEFDHRPGVDKRGEVSRMVLAGVAWSVIEDEIAKCDVRCANCHRRRTCERGGWLKQEAFTRMVEQRGRTSRERLEVLFPAAV